MRRITCLSLAMLSPLVVAPVARAADEPHPHPHGIPEIVITADPLGDVEGHIAAPVTVLGDAQLRLQSLRSIGETVANQLGVSAADFGAGASRPVIRGLGGGRVRVLEDGIGTMDVSTISADHGVALEPVFAEQVEIFRGPAALLYGSGASGGLVNVVNGRIPSRLREKPEAQLYADYDSASDGWMSAFRADASVLGQFALHVDGMRRDTDDLDIPGFAEATPDPDERPGTLPNSATDTENFALGTSWIGSRGFVGFAISNFDNEYGVPGAHHHHEEGEEEEEHGEEEGGNSIDMEAMRYDVDGALEVDAYGIERIKTRWGYSDYEHDEVEADGAVGTRFTNEEVEGRVEVVHRPLGAFDGVVGLQYGDRDFTADGEEAFVPPSTQQSIAVFLFEKADFGQVHLDAGARYENQDADAALAGASASHNLVSVSGGGSFEYVEDHYVGFSGTRSQRGPTIEELFANGPHLATNTFEVGDADLGEETSMNVDLFWRRTAGRYRFDFTLFYNDIADFVFLESSDRNGDGVADRVEPDFLDTGLIVDEDEALLLVRQRQQDAVFWGFELAGEMTVFDDARGLLDARLWSDYTEGELANDDDVPRLPPLRYGFDLDWRRGPLYAAFRVLRVTAPDNVAPLETDTDGYTMVNLDAGYTLRVAGKSEVTLFARGTNLADETARRHTSFVKDLAPLPGASGLVGVRARF